MYILILIVRENVHSCMHAWHVLLLSKMLLRAMTLATHFTQLYETIICGRA